MSGKATNRFFIFIITFSSSSTSLVFVVFCFCLQRWNFPISWQSIKITTLLSDWESKISHNFDPKIKENIRNMKHFTNITHTPRSANALCALFTQLSKKLCQLVCAAGREEARGRGWSRGKTEMENGKGKSHVKLYLDHDSGSLENHPLASSSSSSLKAQLL